MSSSPLLSIHDITMQFGGVVAVDNLSLEVNEGEIVALIGPNGAGKTTAFNCITGVYMPTNGRIDYRNETILESFPRGNMRKIYGGQNLGKYTKTVHSTPDQITRLGIARTFQSIRLFTSLPVFDNVLIAKHMRTKQNILSATLGLNRAAELRCRKETLELLEMQGLAHLMDEPAGSLPYGLQRRLEIARALATGPSLLLLDEPAAGMNPQETNELSEFIAKIKTEFNLTILMIEHHMDLVMGISDRIYVLDFGKLIAQGLPKAIRGNQRVIDAYLGQEGDM